MFTPLSREDVKEVVEIQFREVQKRLAENDISITATPEAIEWLSQLGFDPQFGARPVKRVIQKQILNELSKKILSGEINKSDEIILDMFDNKFVFRNIQNKVS